MEKLGRDINFAGTKGIFLSVKEEEILKAKLQAAEEMATALKAIAVMRFKGKKLECSYFAEEALDTWDKAGKGEG